MLFFFLSPTLRRSETVRWSNGQTPVEERALRIGRGQTLGWGVLLSSHLHRAVRPFTNGLQQLLQQTVEEVPALEVEIVS